MKTTLLALILLGLKAASAQVGLSSDELKLFNLLNQERVKAGLPEFQWTYQLAESARAHTQLQAKRKALSHQFEGEAVLGDRIGATGLRFDIAAENVAAGSDLGDIHAGLMDSPQHRANILNSKYNSVGLAIVPKDGDLYVTEDFAHVLPTYSEREFREGVIEAFQKAREANGIVPVAANANAHLHDLACSDSDNAQRMLQGLSGAVDLVVFTAAAPENLSNGMQKAAADKSLHRLDIGVCFKPGKERGYGSFRIVAALYP